MRLAMLGRMYCASVAFSLCVILLRCAPDRDAGLVILPAYYAASLSTDQDQIIQYYVDICKESPVGLSYSD